MLAGIQSEIYWKKGEVRPVRLDEHAVESKNTSRTFHISRAGYLKESGP